VYYFTAASSRVFSARAWTMWWSWQRRPTSVRVQSGRGLRTMDLKELRTDSNRHPWELSRADMMLQLLSGLARSTRYADVGSGDLYFSKRLSETTDAPVYAVDINYPIDATNGRLVICTDLDQVPSASVDCAVLMDVLEHVDDDVGLLQAVNRVLAPVSHLFVTVPAHAFLWSDHDEFLGHRRRYDRQQLCGVLRRAGLDIVECFSFYGLPFFVRAIQVGLGRLGIGGKSSGAISRWPHPPQHVTTRSMRAVLNGDFQLSRVFGATPLAGLGLSICAICRRTSA
jgi:SAM-dependent methyltransferase